MAERQNDEFQKVLDNDAETMRAKRREIEREQMTKANRELVDAMNKKATSEKEEREGEIELQLKCITFDGANVCLIKIEEGTLEGNVLQTFEAYYPLQKGAIRLFPMSFAEVQAAIESSGTEPPLPRLEGDVENGYGVLVYKGGLRSVSYKEYKAISDLVGKPLPVWKPTKGQWWKIQWCLDIEIWHYERRKDA